jgi:CHAT domain-containing protein
VALRGARKAGHVAEILAAKAALASAEREWEAAVARSQRAVRSSAGLLEVVPASTREIRAALGPEDALVLYVTLDTDLVAVVLTPDDVRTVRIGPRKDVEEAVGALRFEDPATSEVEPLARARSLLIQPLALVDSVRTLLVSPVAELSFVPFAAIAGDRTVAYVPSGTTLRLLRAELRPAGEGILALGDPEYGREGGATARRTYRAGGELAALPHTREEAQAIGDVVLLGAKATESALRTTLESRSAWRAVHLACHGLVDAERPQLSSLALTPGDGADGFLSVLEIYDLPLRADLVTLSACETARGRLYDAEGVVGLTRACMFAGAPRVLVSLWEVDDEATMVLMKAFYEAWNSKDAANRVGAAAALRRAQEHVRSFDRWKHPTYWAAWVLWGLPNG